MPWIQVSCHYVWRAARPVIHHAWRAAPRVGKRIAHHAAAHAQVAVLAPVLVCNTIHLPDLWHAPLAAPVPILTAPPVEEYGPPYAPPMLAGGPGYGAGPMFGSPGIVRPLPSYRPVETEIAQPTFFYTPSYIPAPPAFYGRPKHPRVPPTTECCDTLLVPPSTPLVLIPETPIPEPSSFMLLSLWLLFPLLRRSGAFQKDAF